MKNWEGGMVKLACDALRECISGKKIALMMNTTAIDNEGRLLIDVIINEKWADVEFFFGAQTYGFTQGRISLGDAVLQSRGRAVGKYIRADLGELRYGK